MLLQVMSGLNILPTLIFLHSCNQKSLQKVRMTPHTMYMSQYLLLKWWWRKLLDTILLHYSPQCGEENILNLDLNTHAFLIGVQ